MPQLQEGWVGMSDIFIDGNSTLYFPKDEIEGSRPEFPADAPPPFMNTESITRWWKKCTNEYTKETLQTLEKSGSITVIIGSKEGDVFIFFNTNTNP